MDEKITSWDKVGDAWEKSGESLLLRRLYDEHGNLVEVHALDAAREMKPTYMCITYDEAGRRTRNVVCDAEGRETGDIMEYSYNPAGQLISLRNQRYLRSQGYWPWWCKHFFYDFDGRLIKDTFDGSCEGNGEQRSTEYLYDENGLLSEEKDLSETQGTSYNFTSFRYWFPAGNRTVRMTPVQWRSDHSPSLALAIYNEHGQLLESTEFTAKGEKQQWHRMFRRVYKYEHDDVGNIVEMTEYVFRYDAIGQVVEESKSVTSRKFSYRTQRWISVKTLPDKLWILFRFRPLRVSPLSSARHQGG